jgi:hypothetical protein
VEVGPGRGRDDERGAERHGGHALHGGPERRPRHAPVHEHAAARPQPRTGSHPRASSPTRTSAGSPGTAYPLLVQRQTCGGWLGDDGDENHRKHPNGRHTPAKTKGARQSALRHVITSHYGSSERTDSHHAARYQRARRAPQPLHTSARLARVHMQCVQFSSQPSARAPWLKQPTAHTHLALLLKST